MKVLLLANNIKWRSLDKRITELEKTLGEKIAFVHDSFSITRQDINTDIKIDSWNKHLDAIWYRKNYILDNKDKYDAIGMVITKSDWVKAGGREDLGGFYIVNSDTTHSFYIICNEKSTDRNGALEFEEYVEHELLGHGLNKEFGFIEVNDTNDFIEGQDNTHHFFPDDKKGHYDYLKSIYIPKSIVDSKVITKLLPLNQSWARTSEIDSIVLHTTRGSSVLSSWAWLDKINLSYHYIIDDNGDVYKLAEHNRATWHAGKVSKPNRRAKAFFKDNPNKTTIGIAFSRNGQKELTGEQIQSYKTLIEDNNWQNLPTFVHQEIANNKPKEVHDYKAQLEYDDKGDEAKKKIMLQIIDKLTQLLKLLGL